MRNSIRPLSAFYALPCKDIQNVLDGRHFHNFIDFKLRAELALELRNHVHMAQRVPLLYVIRDGLIGDAFGCHGEGLIEYLCHSTD